MNKTSAESPQNVRADLSNSDFGENPHPLDERYDRVQAERLVGEHLDERNDKIQIGRGNRAREIARFNEYCLNCWAYG